MNRDDSSNDGSSIEFKKYQPDNTLLEEVRYLLDKSLTLHRRKFLKNIDKLMELQCRLQTGSNLN